MGIGLGIATLFDVPRAADPLCYSDCVSYDRFTYPPYGEPLMAAYDGHFESVYVLFHPFIRVPEELAWKATKRYPGADQIAQLGAKYPWAQVASRTGLRACDKLNRALLTSIGSLSPEFCDFPARDALQRFLESESVWMPAEGGFEPLLRMDILDAFEAAGQTELVFVPEFPKIDPVQRLGLQALRGGEAAFPERGSLVAPDASFLFTVDWDSFFTLFYGPLEFVAETVRRQRLEGFFATPTTEHAWFNYSLGCAVVTVSPEAWLQGDEDAGTALPLAMKGR
jgi:hypothetical protein